MDQRLTPGTWVRHPQRSDWGLGQVQSSIDGRITVNFEDAGKQVIDGRVIDLVEVASFEAGPPAG